MSTCITVLKLIKSSDLMIVASLLCLEVVVYIEHAQWKQLKLIKFKAKER